MIIYLLSSAFFFFFFFLDFTFYKEALRFITFILSLCSNMLTLESIFEYIRQKYKKNILILKFHPGMKRLHISFLFFILGWNFIPVFFTGMSSSRDEISSREKGVNSKRHFTIDRDDLIPGRVSSRTSHWVWKHNKICHVSLIC